MPKSDSPASHEHTIGSPQRRSVVTALALAPLAAAAPRAAWAEPTPRNPSASGQLRDWEQYVDLLKPAGKGIDLTWFPGDEQIRAEFYRQLVMNIAQAYVWYFQSSPEHPDWMPFENSIFLLQPNPDAVYHIAPVSGDGVYKVTGYRGTTRIMGFAVGRGMFGTVEPKPGFNNYDADGLTLDADGRFEVIFSAKRPAGWTGDWRYLHPGAGDIMIRQFAYDWGGEVDARFAIERLDKAPLKPRLTTEEIARKLEAILGGFVERFSRICLSYQNKVAGEVGLNKMELSGFEDLGNSGEWPQKYWRCIYDYKPGEALIVETELPAKCKYWNVQLNDELWNQIEYGYRQSSLNALQARLDSDGKFRAVIALEDPGVANWLDSGGHLRGMLVGRWHRADGYPMPSIKKVPFAEIRRHLPADTAMVTAQEREAALRNRNLGLQMRRRW